MSDTLAGLSRRVNNFVHDRETAEELSHILDEAKEPGGDAADALIELALAPVTEDAGADQDLIMDDNDGEVVGAATDDLIDDEEELTEEELAALDGVDLDSELGGDDLGMDDDDELEEATTALRAGELLIF